MKHQFFIAAFMAFALLVAGCSKGVMESGDEAFQQKNYAEALKYYLEAAKEQPDNQALKEKIVLCYFREGESFYEKRQTVKAFEARVKSGLEYLPENPSPEMRRVTSDIHLKLAMAYKNTKGDKSFSAEKKISKLHWIIWKKHWSMIRPTVKRIKSCANLKKNILWKSMKKDWPPIKKEQRIPCNISPPIII